MIRLSREIRFALTAPLSDTRNSWAGWPTSSLAVPSLAARCVVAGQPDPDSGYLCDIKQLDGLLRKIVVDHLVPNQSKLRTWESVACTLFDQVVQAWQAPPTIESVSLQTSPFQYLMLRSESAAMLTLTQQFEFSAAHRLHNPALSDEENRTLFGKCNNPNGHGHNYVVEVTIACNRSPDVETQTEFDMSSFQDTVNRLVIDRLDHKHLNVDVDYFSEVLPSVENIAVAIWNWLDGQFDSTQLKNIRVYETPKTWAEYSG